MATAEIRYVATHGDIMTVDFIGQMHAGSKLDPLVVLVERALVTVGWKRRGFDTRKGKMDFRKESSRTRDITTDELKDLCLRHAANKQTFRFKPVEASLFVSGKPRTPQEVRSARRLQVTMLIELTGNSLPFAQCDASVVGDISTVDQARLEHENTVLVVTWYTDGDDPWSEAQTLQTKIIKALA